MKKIFISYSGREILPFSKDNVLTDLCGIKIIYFFAKSSLHFLPWQSQTWAEIESQTPGGYFTTSNKVHPCLFFFKFLPKVSQSFNPIWLVRKINFAALISHLIKIGSTLKEPSFCPKFFLFLGHFETSNILQVSWGFLSPRMWADLFVGKKVKLMFNDTFQPIPIWRTKL